MRIPPQAHTQAHLNLNRDDNGSLTGLVKIQPIFKWLCLKLWQFGYAFIQYFKLKCLLLDCNDKRDLFLLCASIAIPLCVQALNFPVFVCTKSA